jgi:hypothetical protein
LSSPKESHHSFWRFTLIAFCLVIHKRGIVIMTGSTTRLLILLAASLLCICAAADAGAPGKHVMMNRRAWTSSEVVSDFHKLGASA